LRPPPFRADHVGSLLRPAALKSARAKFANGAISAAVFKEVEDREIESVVRKQQDIGLQSVTDGEFRRTWWHLDFFKGLAGVEVYQADQGGQFRGVEKKPEAIRVAGKIGYAPHPQVEHFAFLKRICAATPKVAIPAPSVFHFRQGRAEISKAVYPDMDEYFADVAAAWRQVIRAFYDAGCRYLQLDDVAWALLCDPGQREQAKARGHDADSLPAKYAETINAALAGRPADMTVTMHSCRGNFRSTFIASGGYEFVAERLLGEVNVDGWFLEFDTERAGGFEPLRFLPKGKKQVALGLVTSKSGEIEPKEAIRRRIDEAARYVSLDQLCLSPQCGFASTEEGNVLAEEEQWAKLRMIVELAGEVWGR
jgi:5-methyltetrahydropteroyltriglutamate--homocysteine methyltransferase